MLVLHFMFSIYGQLVTPLKFSHSILYHLGSSPYVFTSLPVQEYFTTLYAGLEA